MSRRTKPPSPGIMLDVWRPPHGAGDPVGCLATTYTFDPGLFDEQCLARFLDIDSEPDRENLAFLLERERALGGVYAGVLVDCTRAGVEHSLRWDVLPVRAGNAAKQHSKLALLAWANHVRIIVASENLTEPGYRTNQEVAACVELTPHDADTGLLSGAAGFLRALLRLVPGSAGSPREVERAEAFLDRLEKQTRRWSPPGTKTKVRQQLVFTLPSGRGGRPARSALEETADAFRRHGQSPNEVWVASRVIRDSYAFTRQLWPR